jgi:uncharacterized membrane protein YvlD (DUF360 family)
MSVEEIVAKFVLNAILLYGLALLTGGRVKFRGAAPIISVAVFLVPINVFIRELAGLAGIPDNAVYIFIAAAVLNGLMLYALAYIINGLEVEDLFTALIFAAIMGGISVLLNFIVIPRLVPLLGHLI